jgi:hypothetical protein
MRFNRAEQWSFGAEQRTLGVEQRGCQVKERCEGVED